MRRTLGKFGMVAALALSLSACQSGTSGNETGGLLLGAAAGGLLGSQIGSGSGQLAAVAIGTLAGAYLGGQLGQYLDEQDQASHSATTQQTLEYEPSGTTSSWSNPDRGTQGSVTPMSTYQTGAGQYCREFQSTITVDGRTEYATGTACRQPDGSWRIVQ